MAQNPSYPFICIRDPGHFNNNPRSLHQES
jgi:hypothetical protein